MKRNAKPVLVLLTAVGLLLSLCGCSGLENMRNKQAFPGEKGEVLWKGTVYKALPGNENFYVETGDYSKLVYVTEPDVPVLLSSMFSEMDLYPSGDGVFLEDLDAGIYYCREDRYEDILRRMQEEFVPELVCYCYTEYPEAEAYYILTEEQVEAIELILQSVAPTVLGDGMYLDWDYYIDLQACSEDMQFRRDSVSISVSGTTYYLHQYTDEQEQVFTVPETYRAVFEEITRAYIEEMAAYEAEMDDVF
ncbi:MAG: hypothetical protein IKJ94_01320 [Oscillospiraceae bacterium]|nr:hypothetical protein [Oscillospiraceae bacterium]